MIDAVRLVRALGGPEIHSRCVCASAPCMYKKSSGDLKGRSIARKCTAAGEGYGTKIAPLTAARKAGLHDYRRLVQ